MPVLGIDELPDHPHLAARGNIRAGDKGTRSAAPSPRLSGHPDLVTDLNPRSKRAAGEVLSEAGFGADEIAALIEQNIIWSP